MKCEGVGIAADLNSPTDYENVHLSKQRNATAVQLQRETDVAEHLYVFGDFISN